MHSLTEKIFNLPNSTADSEVSENDPSDRGGPLWFGVTACLLAAICFGTLHVPIRRHHTGDGIFVQWAMSAGILSVGFLVNLLEGLPQFELLAMFGGMLWTIANALSQKVISGLGLAVGLVLWSTTNGLTGWATGRFGLFGLKVRSPENDIINVLGLATVMCGGILTAFVKKRPHSLEDHAVRKSSPLISSVSSVYSEPISKKAPQLMDKRRLICIVYALFSGFFYGATVIPVIYMQDHPEHYPSSSRRGLPYIFSHYFGIFVGSTIIFVIYAILRKNKPFVNPQVILPSMCGGVLWGIGMALLFTANDILSQTITYPILATVPGCIAALWSVFYFKEISTRRDYVKLGTSFALVFIGTSLVVVSKLPIFHCTH